MTTPPSDLTRVRRLSQRGAYDRATIDPIIDSALICHVGFVDNGQPVVLPMIFARSGDTLYLHGSAASRLLKSADSTPLCLTFTHIDGLVLARSAFHHSANYRSVMVFGKGRLVNDPAEKLAALEAITNHIQPGRWEEARSPNDNEMRQTTVIAMPLAEASAKIRSGPPIDDKADAGLPVWAGVVPLATVRLAPEADPDLQPGIPLPDYLKTEPGQ